MQYTIGEALKTKLPKLKKGDFVINRPQTLFGPDWKLLEQTRCPHCSCKLHPMQSKKDWYICRSVRHKKSFAISGERINQILQEVHKPVANAS